MTSPTRERLMGGTCHRQPQRFGLFHKRGPSTPPLVDHILLAEFDIDTGSTVRHAYPSSVPGVADDWFADHMLPEGAHNHAQDWTVMFHNRDRKGLDEDWPSPLRPDEGGEDSGKHRVGIEEGRGYFLHCLNLVRKKDDPTVRRGAVVKAMCVCSRYNFIEVFRPLLAIALEQYYQTPEPEVLKSLFVAVNAADIAGTPRPTPWERDLMRRGIADKYMGSVPEEHLTSTWTHMMTFTYGGQNIQATLPLYLGPDETDSSSVKLLVSLLGQNITNVYNAVLTGQRVLFVGYNHAAGDVCEIVLAACALVSPPVQGILHRAFPYASLSDLSFLDVPSFVAGVTNPMFESHPEWWDLLCQLDLPRGTATLITAEEAFADGSSGGIGGSHRGKSASAGASSSIGGSSHSASGADDRPSAKDVLQYLGDSMLATKLVAGVKAGKEEEWVRCECRDYTQGLLNLVLDREAGLTALLTSVSIVKLLDANEGRLRRLKAVAEITKQDADPWIRCRGIGGGDGPAAGGQGMRLRNCIRRFQLEKHMSESHVKKTFDLLCENLRSEAELQVLLGLLPESKGGVGVLALGLLSKNKSIRKSAATLFTRLESFDSTRPAVGCMNDFFKLALKRQIQDLSATSSATATAVATASAGAGVDGGVGGRRSVPA
ncbi:unnamed protein product [Ascophyllum nodosum]